MTTDKINTLDNHTLSLIFVHASIPSPFPLTRVCKRWHTLLSPNNEVLWRALCCHHWPSFSVLPPTLPQPANKEIIIPLTRVIANVWGKHRQTLQRNSAWALDCSASSSWRALFRTYHQTAALRYTNLIKDMACQCAQTMATDKEAFNRMCALSHIAKQGASFPRFWGSVSMEQVDEWMHKLNKHSNKSMEDTLARSRRFGNTNVDKNRLLIPENNESTTVMECEELQFLLDSVLYSFVQQEQTWEDEGLQYSTLVYGSVKSRQGDTVTFFTVVHCTDNPRNDTDFDDYNSFSIGSHYISLASHNLWEWAKWLGNVRTVLGMSQSVRLFRLWHVLRVLMIPHGTTNEIFEALWWDDNDTAFEDTQQGTPQQPYCTSLAVFLAQHATL